MSEKREPSSMASPRIDDLKTKIERASALIGELREANYSLSAELVEVKNRLEAGTGTGTGTGTGAGVGTEQAPPPALSEGESAAEQAPAPTLTAELELLRREREAVRAKLKSLIERIEKLEKHG